ncbi:peroxidase 27 [Jatropha curcas]|uniref:peroxidase 27 n=1 Tax=Jatropha curcas TaxID=180498 RepID=UPI0018958DD2|nr:peroxidase 27 [Jatropha curcas]
MHFHDCFVRGCDGSILLSSTKNNQAEKEAIPNQTLRGFQVIDAVKYELEKCCPGVVSCADILALVARDAVLMIGGPFWDVPTGRRDGTVSVSTEALTQLPSPFANITQLKQNFAAKGLSVKDLVVLSGGHTIGIGHCFIISNRLYNFTGKGDTDPSLDPKYAAQLKKKCKPGNTKTIVEMDPGSFKTFDEDYYTIVSKRRGLFQSDAALLDDFETRAYVKLQSLTHGLFFARDFSESMMKLGQIGVLTGKRGEIRKRCAFVN